MSKNRTVRFVDTTLRDAHQSLIATRMTTEEMIPILNTMDQVGFRALEVWGGATFDACLRYLNEDPWERLRIIRKNIKKTKLQMLLRGQNLLGYKHYPDDVVEKFIEKSIKNGIDIVRVFDALNDIENLQTSVKAIKKYGGEAQACLCYTTSKVHTIEYFVNLAIKLEEMGADSIAIKDMAGILTPQVAFEFISALKSAVSIPIDVHTHATSGVASMTYLKAAEAGADYIDTAISPLAGGTSQPPTESLYVSLSEMGFNTGLDIKKLEEMSAYFKPLKAVYLENGLLNPKVLDIVPETLIYQVPGGMLSNLLSQLVEAGKENLYEKVLQEVPKVRADLGYPPLVTPLSQMVGTQALMNVVSGERYKMVPKEIKDYVSGYYGHPPVPISKKMREIIIGDTKVFTGRPADLLEPGFPQMKKEIGELAHSDEDVLTYGLFPTLGLPFLQKREDPFFDVPIQTVEILV